MSDVRGCNSPKIAEFNFAQIGSRFDGESCLPTGLSQGFE